MLNSALREKITFPEWRLLYDSKIALQDRTVKMAMQKYIKSLRDKYKKNTLDPLVAKMETYGSSGMPFTRGAGVKGKDGRTIKRSGHTGGWYVEKIKELEKILFNEKGVPNDFIGTWRSIEFECIFNDKNAMQEFVGFARSAKLAPYITIKHDGSIANNQDDRNGIPKEVVVAYKSGDEDTVRRILEFMKGRAYVNNSCGTHVHFDHRQSSEKDVELYGKRLARCVPALKMLIPKARRDSKYCKGTVNTLSGRSVDGERTDRYTFINLQAYLKYKTLEIRGHSGTLVADKILNWIKLCELIMLTRVRSKEDTISTPDELIKVYKFDAPDVDAKIAHLAKYIKERAAKFGASSNADEGEAVKTTPTVAIGRQVLSSQSYE